MKKPEGATMDDITREAQRVRQEETRKANMAYIPHTGRPIARLEDEWGRYKATPCSNARQRHMRRSANC
ncbi:MAG: hypothetical protein MZU97_06510 [Bacillus subtilis]|nr:hypothetical protein [Bacillus subtilis]